MCVMCGIGTLISLHVSGDLAKRTSCLWIKIRGSQEVSLQLPSAAKPGTTGQSAQRHRSQCLPRVFTESEGLTELKYLKGKVTRVCNLDFSYLNSSCVPFYVSGCARSQLMFQCRSSPTWQ